MMTAEAAPGTKDGALKDAPAFDPDNPDVPEPQVRSNDDSQTAKSGRKEKLRQRETVVSKKVRIFRESRFGNAREVV